MNSALPSLQFRGLPSQKLRFDEGPRPSWAGKVYPLRGWYGRSDRAKLRFLRSLAQKYGEDPQMRHFVLTQVIPNTADRDYDAQAAGILAWVQNNVRYVNEDGEVIQSPWRTIEFGFGDCDDVSVLMGAMLTSVALPWRYVLAGTDRRGNKIRWVEGTPGPPRGANMAHIYLLVGRPPFNPTKWDIAEPTVKGAPLGQDIAMGSNAQLPEMRGAQAGFGAIGAPPIGRPSTFVDRIIERWSWEDLLVRTIEGAFALAVATYITSYLKRK